MSKKRRHTIINEDGSRECLHCNAMLSKDYFRYGYKYVCFECVLKRNRDKHKAKIEKSGRALKMPLEYLKTGVKKCTNCKQEKNISEFRKINKDKKLLHPFCSKCGNEKNKIYEANNRDKINKKRRERRKNPKTGIVLSLRARHKALFIYKNATKKQSCTKQVLDWLGCSLDYFKHYIEEQFTEGMNWDNRGVGTKKWQLDHKIPISLVEIKNNEIIDSNFNRQIFHYTNLQPLWHTENAKKSNKYEREIAI